DCGGTAASAAREPSASPCARFRLLTMCRHFCGENEECCAAAVKVMDRRLPQRCAVSVRADPAQPLLGTACTELLGALVPAPGLLGVGLDAAHAEPRELRLIEGGCKGHGALREPRVGRALVEQARRRHVAL